MLLIAKVMHSLFGWEYAILRGAWRVEDGFVWKRVDKSKVSRIVEGEEPFAKGFNGEVVTLLPEGKVRATWTRSWEPFT